MLVCNLIGGFSLSRTVVIDPVLLSKVSKPARYVGRMEQCRKNHEDVKLTVAYCFPDVYEVAMSHLGLRILYALLNERKDVAAERVYAPWPDMEELIRSKGYPLFLWKRRRRSSILTLSDLRCSMK